MYELRLQTIDLNASLGKKERKLETRWGGKKVDNDIDIQNSIDI
jgi:hypothetical protein